MRDLFKSFQDSESGATLVEYGVALIVAIVVGGAALSSLADETSGNMNESCSSMIATDHASLFTNDC